ncbi:MAG: hypothetical protein RLZZ350_921 [Verrucomicrobiota bacterium]
MCSGCNVVSVLKEREALSADASTWPRTSHPYYNFSFAYPAGATITQEGWSLPGGITDDKYKPKLEIDMQPVYSIKYAPGVYYRFVIGFSVITDSAKLNTLDANRYRWQEQPSIQFYPFNFVTDKNGLLKAVERLCLGKPVVWRENKPVTVDGKPGVWASSRDEDVGILQDFAIVPLAPTQILLIQSEYKSGYSAEKLKLERRVFMDVMNSLKF